MDRVLSKIVWTETFQQNTPIVKTETTIQCQQTGLYEKMGKQLDHGAHWYNQWINLLVDSQ